LATYCSVGYDGADGGSEGVEYRFSSREVPNEAWNKMNREYEAANLELESAQKALEGAQAHGKEERNIGGQRPGNGGPRKRFKKRNRSWIRFLKLTPRM